MTGSAIAGRQWNADTRKHMKYAVIENSDGGLQVCQAHVVDTVLWNLNKRLKDGERSARLVQAELTVEQASALVNEMKENN